MWHLGIWFSHGLGSAGLRMRLDGHRGFLQPEQFCGSVKQMLCGIWLGPKLLLYKPAALPILAVLVVYGKFLETELAEFSLHCLQINFQHLAPSENVP